MFTGESYETPLHDDWPEYTNELSDESQVSSPLLVFLAIPKHIGKAFYRLLFTSDI